MQIILILLFIGSQFGIYQLTSISDYGVTLVDVFLIAFYILTFKKIFWDGVKLRFSWHPGLWFLFLLYIAIIFSAIPSLLEGNSAWLFQYFKSSSHFLYLSLFALICAVYPIDIKNWRNYFKAWLICALILDIFAIYQIIARAYDWPLAFLQITNYSSSNRFGGPYENEILQLSLRYGDFFRATSIFTEPSALGGFNTYTIAFLVIPIINGYKHFVKSKTFIVFTIIFCVISQLFTFSMTGFVGFLLIFFGIVFFEKVKKLSRYMLISLACLCVIVVADSIFSRNLGVSVVELFTRRIEGIVHWGDVEKEVPGESFGVRMLSGKKAFNVWLDYPLTGIGIGLTQYNKKYDIVFSDFSVMAVLAETGIIGVIGFTGIFVSLIITSISYIRRKKMLANLSDDEKSVASLMFYIMLTQILINYISGNNFIGIGLWIPIATVYSVINIINIKYGRYVVEISLVPKPLKQVVGQSISSYLNSKKQPS